MLRRWVVKGEIVKPLTLGDIHKQKYAFTEHFNAEPNRIELSEKAFVDFLGDMKLYEGNRIRNTSEVETLLGMRIVLDDVRDNAIRIVREFEIKE